MCKTSLYQNGSEILGEPWRQGITVRADPTLKTFGQWRSAVAVVEELEVSGVATFHENQDLGGRYTVWLKGSALAPHTTIAIGFAEDCEGTEFLELQSLRHTGEESRSSFIAIGSYQPTKANIDTKKFLVKSDMIIACSRLQKE